MTMTDPIIDRLDQIKGRADKATEGEWSFFKDTRLDGMPVYRIGSNETGEDIGSVPRYRHSDDGERDAEFIVAARTDVPQMEAALRAMLDLHKPIEVEPSDTVCGECSTLLPIGRFLRTFEWPCPTVRAVADALAVETEGEE